jgi:hypothetical protein
MYIFEGLLNHVSYGMRDMEISPNLPECMYTLLLEGESRFIRLNPGQFPDSISFELQPFSLEPGKPPFYEAISYTLGHYADMKQAICCGRHMKITPTVDAVLRRFRLSDSIRHSSHQETPTTSLESLTMSLNRYLWIDAVCIN